MSVIKFQTKPLKIRKSIILRLPDQVSKQLPSRGQVAIKGTANNHSFQTVIEPDGKKGHWIKLDKKLQKAVGANSSNTVTLQIEPIKEWPEPTVPEDFAKALGTAPQKVKDKWKDITPMARWEWVRWVNSTSNKDTRAVRVEKSMSKLNGSHRRPCCFNLAACTDPELSKSGVLIQPS